MSTAEDIFDPLLALGTTHTMEEGDMRDGACSIEWQPPPPPRYGRMSPS